MCRGGSTAVELWAGNGVASHLIVDIDEDTGIFGRVQFHTRGARSKLVGPSARDLEIDTLRVVLSAIFFVGRMQGDDLMTKDIVSGSDVLGDGDGPAHVGGDEIVGSPIARFGCPAVETGLVDLIEFKCGLVDVGAFAVAVG